MAKNRKAKENIPEFKISKDNLQRKIMHTRSGGDIVSLPCTHDSVPGLVYAFKNYSSQKKEWDNLNLTLAEDVIVSAYEHFKEHGCCIDHSRNYPGLDIKKHDYFFRFLWDLLEPIANYQQEEELRGLAARLMHLTESRRSDFLKSGDFQDWIPSAIYEEEIDRINKLKEQVLVLARNVPPAVMDIANSALAFGSEAYYEIKKGVKCWVEDNSPYKSVEVNNSEQIGRINSFKDKLKSLLYTNLVPYLLTSEKHSLESKMLLAKRTPPEIIKENTSLYEVLFQEMLLSADLSDVQSRAGLMKIANDKGISIPNVDSHKRLLQENLYEINLMAKMFTSSDEPLKPSEDGLQITENLDTGCLGVFYNQKLLEEYSGEETIISQNPENTINEGENGEKFVIWFEQNLNESHHIKKVTYDLDTGKILKENGE